MGPRTTHSARGSRSPSVIVAILAALVATTMSPIPTATAATVVPGQDDGLRVTPVVRVLGDSGATIRALDTDAVGNIYIAGHGAPSSLVETDGTRTDTGGDFIAKLGIDGNPIWVEDVPFDALRALKIDAAGDVYVTGNTGDGDVGGVALELPAFPGVPYNGPFVAKFNGNGTGAAWAAVSAEGLGIGVHPNGGFVYTVGRSGSAPQILRIDPTSGATMWTRQFGFDDTAFFELFNDVEVLDDGSPVAAGWFQQSLWFDPPTKSNGIHPIDGSTLIVRYQTDGDVEWFRQMGGFQATAHTRIVKTPTGDLVVGSEQTQGNSNFGGITAPPTGSDRAFAARLDATTSTVEWVGFVTSPSLTPAFDDGQVAVDGAGNVTFITKHGGPVVAHGTNGTITIPGAALGTDAVIGWTPSGALRFARDTFLTGNEDFFDPLTRAVAMLPGGDFLQAGTLTAAADTEVGNLGPGMLLLDAEEFEQHTQFGSFIARYRFDTTPPARPPGRPTFVSAVANEADVDLATAADVQWRAPADTGGSVVTGHTVLVRCQPQGIDPQLDDQVFDVPGPTLTLPVVLPLGCRWIFDVRAYNAVGPGPWSGFAPLIGRFAADAGLSYHPLGQPSRIMDTRDGTGPVPVAKLGPGQTIDLFVDRFTSSIGTAKMVALNVTAVFPSAGTHLTVWAAGDPLPPTSNLNANVGEVTPNFVVSPVNPFGSISIRNNSGDVDVLVDMMGWYEDFPFSTNTRFEPVTPVRLLDTRDGTGLGGPGSAGPIDSSLFTGKATFPVAGQGGVPGDGSAIAAVVNLTGTGPTAPTHFTLSDSAFSLGGTSHLNLAAGQTAANLAITTIGGDGTVTVWNNSGKAHAIVDIVGYFVVAQPPVGVTQGDGLRRVAPLRILDTRDGTGLPGGTAAKVGPGGEVTLEIQDLPELQYDGKTVTAISANVTAVLPSTATHITVWPSGAAQPLASSLNVPAGTVRANHVMAKVGADGRITLRNNSGNVDLLVDLVGYYVGIQIA